MMRVTLSNEVQFDLYQLDEVEEAAGRALRSNSRLYCWKTSGRANWLERGVTNVDTLGIVVLPDRMRDYIKLPNDVIDREDCER